MKEKRNKKASVPGEVALVGVGNGLYRWINSNFWTYSKTLT